MIGITGSHGFIGKHLCKYLDQLGVQYKTLDRSGNIPKGVTEIFDLAAYGNLAGHEADPEITYEANVQRLAKMLPQMKDIQLIYVSTSSVNLPVQTYYSASKKAAEEMIQVAVKNDGLEAVIVRPFTIIGQGEHKEHLIPKLIDSCIWGVKMPFVGHPVHDFLDVHDFVDALYTIWEDAKFKGEVYEVGSGKQTTNDKIRKMVEKVTNCKATVEEVKSLRKYDTRKWVADLRKIKKLCWKPTTSIEQSIREMIPEHLPM